MTDVHSLGTTGSPLDLLAAGFAFWRVGSRRRQPRDRQFTQYRNDYGAELVTSQGGPETITIVATLHGAAVQTLLTASDSIDAALAAARDYHFTNPEDRDSIDAILYTRQFGNQTNPMIWDVLDGDWDMEVERLGGNAKRIEGTLTLYCNRIPAVQSAGLTTPFFVVSSSLDVVPAKAQNTLVYVVNVATATASVTVTPTAAAGVIEVNGVVVATGVASGSIALGAAGSITRATITVTETGKAPKEYTIDIVRATS
jgi:hypothetical protein